MSKGGVWKNTEDEILKAAVMKYGKNQWARIASLLARKSAKQCKARWYEWLDPSIKKTEWNRDEEEKLLHLAKLMPTQWRTIAPIVGRTAAQCMEHYERLLDAAQEKDEDYDASEDPRRLRPGEIDPQPETKPARPDPVDMDEDEKEMLSEARARLANTRGKKAKRKAREKQLEEARRLASLQKRRELKAAGIEMKARSRKRKFIDYIKEIPFEKQVPAGFYDTTAENITSSDPNFQAKNLDKLEDERRDRQEKKEQARDKRKQKKMMQANMPLAVMQINQLNDPNQSIKRSKLSLPAPQVSDQELEDIVKLGYQAAEAPAAGSGASSVLLGDYQQTPTAPTPMRTPMTAPGSDAVMQEAQNLIALTNSETPLKGGDSAELHQGTGFGGVTPMSTRITTPNVLVSGATPGRTPSTVGGRTPLSIASGTPGRGGVTPGRTPMRDELSINQEPEFEGSQRAVRAREKNERRDLASKLGNLPEPQYAYEINMPEVDEEEDNDGMDDLEEDAEERDRRLREQEEAEEQLRLKRRSQCIQRELPRPIEVPVELAATAAEAEGMDVAQQLLNEEVQKMLTWDAVKYPVVPKKKALSEKQKAKQRRREDKARLPFIPDADLQAAQQLLREELAGIAKESGDFDSEDYVNAADKMRSKWLYHPLRKEHAHADTMDESELLESVKFQFESVRGCMAKDAKRAQKLETKLGIVMRGLMERAVGLRAGCLALHSATDKTSIELKCFEMLARNETAALPIRKGASQQCLSEEATRESELQLRYKRLAEEKEELANLLTTTGAQ
jgi:pre-mRNA-splicing factor CDC5/CEF1